MFEKGQRVRVRTAGIPDIVWVRYALPGDEPGAYDLILVDEAGFRHEVNLRAGDAETVQLIPTDGAADSARVLAGMWTRWMSAAATNAESSAIASTQLRPYAHQTTAVYGAMLPQPLLRFLLADEPGTGKTIMAGLYLREMQRLGIGTASNHRLSREPHLEMGRRFPSLPRRRTAPPHRKHSS